MSHNSGLASDAVSLWTLLGFHCPQMPLCKSKKASDCGQDKSVNRKR